MGYTLQRRWGDAVRDADEKTMDAALAELDASDPEHPDTWIDSDTGWSLIAYESGSLVLEQMETGDGPRHMANVPRDQVKRLWVALARGDVDAVLAEPWTPGYHETPHRG